MKVLTVWLVLVAAVVVVAGVYAARNHSHAEPSGLHGRVQDRLHCGRPPCPPARRLQLTFTNGSNTVVTFTDGRGRFSVLLEPGRQQTGLTPSSVTVRAGHFDHRDFTYP